MSILPRRQFLLAGAVAALSYVRLVEPRLIDETIKKVRLGKSLPSPIRVLHLSDFHYSEDVPLYFIAESIDRGLSANPDIICVTGDFVTNRHMNLQSYPPILKMLSARAPTYACLGNHDGGKWAASTNGYHTIEPMQQLLDHCGIRLLQNDREDTTIRGTKVRLVGVGDLWSGDVEGALAFGDQAHQNDVTILLAHNPDSKDSLGVFDWDLMLAGHTHGGQLIIPFSGAAPLAPVKDRRFLYGLHDWCGRKIHINRGIGSLHCMRFNCLPEVSILDIMAS